MQGIRRKTQAVKEALGQSMSEKDHEYDYLDKQFKESYEITNDIKSNVELLIKQLRDVTITLGVLAKYCGDIHVQAGHSGQLPSKLVTLADELEMKTIKPLQTNIDAQVIQPLAEYLEKFTPVEKLQRKRRNFILDKDFYRDKVASRGKNLIQLSVQKEKLRVAQELFYDIDMITKTSMVAHRMKQYEMVESVGHHLFDTVREFSEILNRCVTVVAHRDPNPEVSALCSAPLSEKVSSPISDEPETLTSLSVNEVLDVPYQPSIL